MKTLVYCDTTNETGKEIIRNSIWYCIEQDFFLCSPRYVEFVTDGMQNQDLKKFQSALLPGYLMSNYIHFAELEEIVSRRDCGLIIDLSRLNYPEGTRGRIQNYLDLDYVDLLGVMPHPEIICLYKTSGLYPTINELVERNGVKNQNEK